jgi:LAS superfamily LD-carboxypeptidase LdcB
MPDTLQIDPTSNLIPVTGQVDNTAPTSGQALEMSMQDLSSFLAKPQGQQQTQAATTTSYDPKTQASLDSLQPDFADRTKQWIDGMQKAGYNPVLHFGTRSVEEQQALYEKHLAGGPQAVAPPMSYHTYGRAFDWVNKGSDGKLQWDNDKAYQVGQALAKNYGLTGIGAGDNDHIQDGNYKSWKDLPRTEYGNIAKRAAQPSPSPVQLAATDTGQPTWQNLSQFLASK